jgi:predicted nicotinamide N-methyase
MSDADVLSTTAGDLPLEEVQLDIDGRTWSILHTGALVTAEQELAFLQGENQVRRPYGIVLWPSAIALAHELATRKLAGAHVLELGAGTGLPGIVAASLGARVVQTDRQQLALHVCRQNAARNGAVTDCRTADWTAWSDDARYDLIVAADCLYAEPLHPYLRRIFEGNLAPGGAVLVADPFRPTSVQLLEQMQTDGWRVAMDRWTVGIAPPLRPVGVFTLTRAM